MRNYKLKMSVAIFKLEHVAWNKNILQTLKYKKGMIFLL